MECTHAMNPRTHLSPSIALLLLLLSSAIRAAAPTEAITIQADRLSLNEKAGSSLYSGHVELRQGELLFLADTLLITSAAGEVTRLQATGSPSSFERQGGSPLKATAKVIIYDAASDQVTLEGDAHLWQDGSHFSGNSIEYQISTNRVIAQGGGQGDGRVHVTLQPRKE